MRILRYPVIFLCLLLITGCFAAERVSGDEQTEKSKIPRINQISIIFQGERQIVHPGRTYVVTGSHYFEVQVSADVTVVEYLFQPKGSDSNIVMLYSGTETAEGVFTVECPYGGEGTGYFMAYNLNDGNSIGVRSEEFTLAAPC